VEAIIESESVSDDAFEVSISQDIIGNPSPTPLMIQASMQLGELQWHTRQCLPKPWSFISLTGDLFCLEHGTALVAVGDIVHLLGAQA
jgi:hypothetical protein